MSCQCITRTVCLIKYSLWGSNPRPMAHKTIALTTELREHLQCMCGTKTYWICPILAVHEGEYPDHHWHFTSESEHEPVSGKYRTEPKPDLNWVLGSVAMSSWIWQKQKQRLGNRNRNRNQVWFGFGLVCLCLALGEGEEDNQTKTETETRSGYGFDFPVFVCASTQAKKTSQPGRTEV
jgi:hypothetical protein